MSESKRSKPIIKQESNTITNVKVKEIDKAQN